MINGGSKKRRRHRARAFVTTSQPTQFLAELAAGHSGPEVPLEKRAYFQARFRNRLFDFVLSKFQEQQKRGLTKAILARRIGKRPDVLSSLLGAPGNWTLDTVSDLLVGICAEELDPIESRSLLGGIGGSGGPLPAIPPCVPVPGGVIDQGIGEGKMCIICNMGSDPEKVAFADQFLLKFCAAQMEMRAAADAMLACSKAALTPEARKQYDQTYKAMVRQMRDWNRLEMKREHSSPTASATK